METILTFDKSHPLLEDMRWVLKARKREKDSYPQDSLLKIYYEDGLFLATDGHRLHMFDSGQLNGGKALYRVVNEKKNEIVLALEAQGDDVKYPDVWSVLQDCGVKEKSANSKSLYSPSNKQGFSYLYTAVVRLFEKCTVAINFIEDLFSESFSFVCFFTEDSAPLTFADNPSNPLHFALVMPMCTD